MQGQHQRDQREADQIDPLFRRLPRSRHFHGGHDIAPGRARLLGQALKTDQIDHFIAAATLKRREFEAKGRRPAGLRGRLERQQAEPVSVIGLPGEMHAHALLRLDIKPPGHEISDRDLRERRRNFVHHIIGPEQGEHRDQQQDGLIPAHLDQQPALGDRTETEDRQQRDDEDHDPVQPGIHPDQQQFRVEDEHERQQRGADIIEKALHPGAQRVFARDGRGRKGRQTDRRGRIRHQAEIEHKQVHGDQRQFEAGGGAEFHQHPGQQRGHHQIIGRGRQAHAQQQREQRGQDQQQIDIAAGQGLDHAHHGVVEAR